MFTPYSNPFAARTSSGFGGLSNLSNMSRYAQPVQQKQEAPKAPEAPPGQAIQDASKDRVSAMLAQFQKPMQPMDMGSVIAALQARMGQAQAPAAPPVLPEGSPIQGPMLAALARR